MSPWLHEMIALATKRLEQIEPERLEIIRRKYERPESKRVEHPHRNKG